MFREKQSEKMETRSACQQILLIAKFPDLRTTNGAQVESAKRTKMQAYRVLGELRMLEFEFSQFMRLFLISNLSLLRVGNEGEMFFIWSLSALSRA